MLIANLMNMIQLRFEDSETAYSHGIQLGTGKNLLEYLRQAVEHDRNKRAKEIANYTSAK